MESGVFGKMYIDNEIIIKQGEKGDSLYIIQEGLVKIIKEVDGSEVPLATLGKGDFFGEMAIFEGNVRVATARAKGNTKVLTLDKRKFLRRVHEDPSLLFRIAQTMSARIREQGEEISHFHLYGR